MRKVPQEKWPKNPHPQLLLQDRRLVTVDTDSTIVFVEVRTKADSDFASPEDSITTPKKTRLLRTARYFLATNNIHDRPYRFDIVAIVLDKNARPDIKHYKNAFVP